MIKYREGFTLLSEVEVFTLLNTSSDSPSLCVKDGMTGDIFLFGYIISCDHSRNLLYMSNSFLYKQII